MYKVESFENGYIQEEEWFDSRLEALSYFRSCCEGLEDYVHESDILTDVTIYLWEQEDDEDEEELGEVTCAMPTVWDEVELTYWFRDGAYREWFETCREGENR